MNDMAESRAKFRSMDEGTAEDWALIGDNFRAYSKDLPGRILKHLKLLDGDFGGFQVDRVQHSLQTATRAHKDGRSEDYVVMALLHDIGDTLGTFNHADIAAAILKPFVNERLHWITSQHGIFQGYYFFHHIGLDQDARESFRGHEHFIACAEFCEKYDQAAFDPNYKSASLEFFEPMVQRVFAKPLRSIYKPE